MMAPTKAGQGRGTTKIDAGKMGRSAMPHPHRACTCCSVFARTVHVFFLLLPFSFLVFGQFMKRAYGAFHCEGYCKLAAPILIFSGSLALAERTECGWKLAGYLSTAGSSIQRIFGLGPSMVLYPRNLNSKLYI